MTTKTCDFSVPVASVALLFLSSLLLHCASVAGTEHVVGDSIGWIVPPNTTFYATWASSKIFHLNDTLSFKFTTGEHDVVRVPKESYDSCSENNHMGNILRTGPAVVNLNETGTHYFICSIGQHCTRGQKLTVTVSSSSATSPSPNAQPPPPTPPSSAAPPALAGGFFFIMLSFALAKLVL